MADALFEGGEFFGANVVRKQRDVEILMLFLDVARQAAVAVQFLAANLAGERGSDFELLVVVQVQLQVDDRCVRIGFDFRAVKQIVAAVPDAAFVLQMAHQVDSMHESFAARVAGVPFARVGAAIGRVERTLVRL